MQNTLSRLLFGHAATFILATVFLLAGCASVPESVPRVEKRPVPLKVGLALSSGAGRGFAHIGVIKALEANGIQVDIIAGSSAGAFVGALYASGMGGMALQEAAMKLDEAQFKEWSLSAKGLITGKPIQDYINGRVRGKTIERFLKPIGVVATDLGTGQAVVFRSGDTGVAVRASCAVPGVYAPVRISGRDYVDGAVSSPVPVRAVREMGANFVIAVDIGHKPRWSGAVESGVGVLMQSANVMGHVISQNELREADFVISPEVSDVDPASFTNRYEVILRGERATNEAMPRLLAELRKRRESRQ
jgi:NTE family protein